VRQPVFIGDVQGCADELDELLVQVRSAFGDGGFEPWLVGDLVNRGPANLRVLERARGLVEEQAGRVVLGNHDVALIAVHLGLRAPRPRDTFGDVPADSAAGDWIEWLRTRPLVATGRLGARPFAMVHAAVAPDWSLETLAERARRVEARLGAPDPAQARALLEAPASDPDRDALERMTRCRSVDARGAWHAREPARPGHAWHRRWAAFGHGYGVVYGHWAMQGLQRAPGLRGIDTGCVHRGLGGEGRLTAWAPDLRAADPFALPDAGRLFHARARRDYFREVLESVGPVDSP